MSRLRDAWRRVHVPWQLSGALGWAGLASFSTLAEVGERESPSQAASYEAAKTTLSAAALASLRSQGYLVIDDALDDATLAECRAECASLRKAGALVATDQHAEALRSDAVTWVQRSSVEEKDALLRLASGVRQTLVISPAPGARVELDTIRIH